MERGRKGWGEERERARKRERDKREKHPQAQWVHVSLQGRKSRRDTHMLEARGNTNRSAHCEVHICSGSRFTSFAFSLENAS